MDIIIKLQDKHVNIIYDVFSIYETCSGLELLFLDSRGRFIDKADVRKIEYMYMNTMYEEDEDV